MGSGTGGAGLRVTFCVANESSSRCCSSRSSSVHKCRRCFASCQAGGRAGRRVRRYSGGGGGLFWIRKWSEARMCVCARAQTIPDGGEKLSLLRVRVFDSNFSIRVICFLNAPIFMNWPPWLIEPTELHPFTKSSETGLGWTTGSPALPRGTRRISGCLYYQKRNGQSAFAGFHPFSRPTVTGIWKGVQWVPRGKQYLP